MLDTRDHLTPSTFPPIRRDVLQTLQVNLGYLCNQSCQHCHVDAGPRRTEVMAEDTIADVLALLERSDIRTLDLTGGAPEMNPLFRTLVEGARALGVHVIDRCNLTILTEPGQQDLAAFLADHRVEVTASMPCYLEENVNAQRGNGVFERSMQGLRQLNALGYASADTGLQLNLVYNPQGPVLPPPQCSLEQDYRDRLAQQGVIFSQLFILANMPIKRFGSLLMSTGRFDDYLQTLRGAHSHENLQSVMCRSLVSVDWRGQVYDCDFNQMLEMPLGAAGGVHVRDLDAKTLTGCSIAVAEHCYGCTAGQGSSCGGALD